MEYEEELMHSIIAELDEPLSLEHVGVKGKSGRYPWGSGDRPYQRLEGTSQMPSRTARHAYDKKRKALAKQAEKAQAKQQKKQQKADIKAAKEEAKKKEDERKEQERIQKEKDEALKDPRKFDAARKKYDFSEEEVNKALSNFEWDKKIETYSIEKMQRAQRKIDTMLGYGERAVNFYNFAASVVNSIDPDSKLPILSKGKDNRADIAKRDKEDKDAQAKRAREEKTAQEQSKVRYAQYQKTMAETKKAEMETEKVRAEVAKARNEAYQSKEALYQARNKTRQERYDTDEHIRQNEAKKQKDDALDLDAIFRQYEEDKKKKKK